MNRETIVFSSYPKKSEHCYSMASCFTLEEQYAALRKGNYSMDLLDENGDTLLILACKEGNRQLVEILLDHKANPNLANYYGYTPLYFALEKKHYYIVDILADFDVDFDYMDKNGRTYLAYYINRGDIDVISFILSRGASANTRDIMGIHPLTQAIHLNNLDIVKILVKYGTDITSPELFPVYEALRVGNIDMIKYLIENGANVHSPDKNTTTLIYASKKGLKEVIKLLIENGEDVNKQDIYGNTALIQAVKHYSILKILLEENADPNIKNNEGKTAFWFACMMGRKKTANLLFQYDADIVLSEEYPHEMQIFVNKIYYRPSGALHDQDKGGKGFLLAKARFTLNNIYLKCLKNEITIEDVEDAKNSLIILGYDQEIIDSMSLDDLCDEIVVILNRLV